MNGEKTAIAVMTFERTREIMPVGVDFILLKSFLKINERSWVVRFRACFAVMPSWLRMMISSGVRKLGYCPNS